MSLTTLQFVCENGHWFEAPGTSLAPGEFILHGENEAQPALLIAPESAVYSEVDRLLDRLGAYAGKDDPTRTALLHEAFAVACDPAPDGAQLKFVGPPQCPECGTREMESWWPVRPYTGTFFEITHVAWLRLSDAEKQDLLGREVTAINERAVIQRLRDEIVRNLNDTVSICLCRIVERPGQDRDRLTALLTDLGYAVAENRIVSIERDAARLVAIDVINGLLRVGSRAQRRAAGRLFAEFVSLFASTARFYSIRDYRVGDEGSLLPAIGWRVTDRSLDSGFFVADDERVGVVWAGDED